MGHVQKNPRRSPCAGFAGTETRTSASRITSPAPLFFPRGPAQLLTGAKFAFQNGARAYGRAVRDVRRTLAAALSKKRPSAPRHGPCPIRRACAGGAASPARTHAGRLEASKPRLGHTARNRLADYSIPTNLRTEARPNTGVARARARQYWVGKAKSTKYRRCTPRPAPQHGHSHV